MTAVSINSVFSNSKRRNNYALVLLATLGIVVVVVELIRWKSWFQQKLLKDALNQNRAVLVDAGRIRDFQSKVGISAEMLIVVNPKRANSNDILKPANQIFVVLKSPGLASDVCPAELTRSELGLDQDISAIWPSRVTVVQRQPDGTVSILDSADVAFVEARAK